jgi:UDP-N-acetylglucosamine/UDP-N-acetylgalactosamine diphosphorylase
MKKEYILPEKVIELMNRGVRIPAPCSVEIGKEIDIERIAGDGVVFHSGAKIYGEKTLIASGTELGYESPVSLTNCQTGCRVKLKGGTFKESIFLNDVNISSGAQIREGCILEEEASGGHNVGLKQTILFPFVTLGSLINFCDCLMAGGTSRKNHSEVGSSYVHFNYTPNQDKATASLVGDVPKGVMLNQPPIFLGGQGGLVGPARVGYGTVIAAGTIFRGDCPEGKRILRGGGSEAIESEFHPGFYRNVERKIYNNIYYLANLLALRQWYVFVRKSFFRSMEFGPELYEGVIEKIDMAIEERIKRFEIFSGKMEKSIESTERILSGDEKNALIDRKRKFLERWPTIKKCFTEGREENIAPEIRDLFLKAVESEKDGKDYIGTIQSLRAHDTLLGTKWLRAIVDEITESAMSVLE